MNQSYHSTNLISRNALAAVWLSLMLFFAACTSPRLDRELDDLTLGSKFQPSNLYSVDELPQNFRRVAVLPVNLENVGEADPAEINSVILAELRRTGRFEVVEISPEILFRLVGASRLSTLGAFPEDLKVYLQTQIKADGFFQADLTSYRPYRPFEVGIRARLVELNTSTSLWAVDEVLNAGEKTVYTGSRHYSLGNAHNRYPFEDSFAALRSPNRFTAYTAFTLFETIPGFNVVPAL